MNNLKINGREYLIDRKLREDWGETLEVPSGRAISIRQPFVELILQGKKKKEYLIIRQLITYGGGIL